MICVPLQNLDMNPCSLRPKPYDSNCAGQRWGLRCRCDFSNLSAVRFVYRYVHDLTEGVVYGLLGCMHLNLTLTLVP